jgi:hypothetical protein
VGIDPTVISGPLITTLVEASGLFIYLTIAKLTVAGAERLTGGASAWIGKHRTLTRKMPVALPCLHEQICLAFAAQTAVKF